MAKDQTLKFKRTVQASPTEAFRAFVNSTALREWFCDVATTEAQPDGRFYLAWNSGYFATGRYKKLAPGQKLSFTWQGDGEPETTEVRVTFAEKAGGTGITVAHSGVGGGKKWAAHAEAIAQGWQKGLENLQSVLETGLDRRITERPMLGVSGLEPLTPETTERLGTPVSRGVRLDGTVPGMGAAAAGLQKDDVLVSVAGQKVHNFPSLADTLQQLQAGDKVPVVFYRGAEKRQATLELSRRPVPDMPAAAHDLAEAVRAIYNQCDADLEQALQGVDEAAASYRPAPHEWSVKHVLAHLIVGERENQVYAAELIAGQQRWYDQYPGNVPELYEAVAGAHGTLPALLDLLKRTEAETVALVAALSDEFVARKGSYRRLANSLLQTAEHTRDHLRQIEAVLEGFRVRRED